DIFLFNFQRVQETILKLDLNHFKNKLIKYLDKDVARRTALAKAVIGGPKILLIDDSYEDNIFQCRKTLRSVIRSACSKDCTVIILSKGFEEAEFLSERLATFEGGRIVHIGNIKAQDESILPVYQQLGLHPSRHSSYSSTNNSLINEIPNVIFTEDDSCSSLTFPVFDKPRSQRENLYDNNQREVNDNFYQCHRRTLSNRMRRGSGGSKLTPCSTPQPPRTPPEVQQCKPKLKSLEDVHLFCDGNPPHLSSSSKTPTFTKSQDYFPNISQRSSDSVNKDSLVEDYLKTQNETSKSRGMIDRIH
ncbi:ABC transporter A family member 3, partial [Armadillidium nasatum]